MKKKDDSRKADHLTFEPLNGRVMVRQDTPSDKVGKIFVAKELQTKESKGKVIAVAKDTKVVKVGDTVYFAQYSGVEIQLDKEYYLVIKDEDLIGVI